MFGKIFLLLVFIVLFNQQAFAQNIEMNLNFWGLKFTQEEERLSFKEVIDATASNETAQKLLKKGKTQNIISSITSLASGALVGIPLGQSFSDVDPKWTLAYIGGALLVVSIPLSINSFNNINNGIDTYNQSVLESGYRFKPKFNINARRNEIGLAMVF